MHRESGLCSSAPALRRQAGVCVALASDCLGTSRHMLGRMHSLLTAAVCRMRGLRVAGWIFNDQYGNYEEEIVRWTGYPRLGSIPFRESPDGDFVKEQAEGLQAKLAYL